MKMDVRVSSSPSQYGWTLDSRQGTWFLNLNHCEILLSSGERFPFTLTLLEDRRLQSAMRAWLEATLHPEPLTATIQASLMVETLLLVARGQMGLAREMHERVFARSLNNDFPVMDIYEVWEAQRAERQHLLDGLNLSA